MTQTMPELKPCPFCGGKVEVGRASPEWPMLFKVGCTDNNCIGNETGSMFLTAQDAACAWNRRFVNTCTCTVCITRNPPPMSETGGNSSENP